MSVLNESTKLLHTQTKRLLKEPDSPYRVVDSFSITQARRNMNTVAKLIQTKINFVKVLK
jgi:hypothetical protein